MNEPYQLVAAFLIAFLTALICTPIFRKTALKYGITDKPENRKVHTKSMPTMGGLAMIAGTAAGLIFLSPVSDSGFGIMIGFAIIIIVGIIDDKQALSPKTKLFGQFTAAFCAALSGVSIQFISIPFIGKIELGFFSLLLTIIWIVSITNAINLIDGLDGLAAGVTVIALMTIFAMALMHNQWSILPYLLILIGSILGFLPYNFHPAKLFMGDTGSMFLGYAISIISILGFLKSVTFFSLIIPVLILGVPIFDTLFAIIRRIQKRQSISKPDKAHLHHRLMAIGFSHRSTVLTIYMISIIFSLVAITITTTTFKSALILLVGMLIFIFLIAEMIGLVSEKNLLIIGPLKKGIKKPRSRG